MTKSAICPVMAPVLPTQPATASWKAAAGTLASFRTLPGLVPRVLNVHGVSSEVFSISKSLRKTSKALQEQDGLGATPPPFLKTSTPISPAWSISSPHSGWTVEILLSSGEKLLLGSIQMVSVVFYSLSQCPLDFQEAPKRSNSPTTWQTLISIGLLDTPNAKV